MKKKFFETLIVFIVIVATFVGCSNSAKVENEYTGDNLVAHFIDVGQGDSTFIELPNGENLLIDAGDVDCGNTVVDYIKNLGVERIDYLVATHPHADHIGGMNKVIDNLDIGSIYVTDVTTTTRVFERLLTSIEKKELSIDIAEAGKEILIDSEIKIAFLAPITKTKDLNNMSAVLQLQFGGVTFLFTGDAEKKVEKEILKKGYSLKADVMKVGHHGSKTSSLKKFIEKVKPKYSVISCGKDNSYGHPSKEVLKILKSVGSKIYRTDEKGTIVITSDGRNVKVKD